MNQAMAHPSMWGCETPILANSNWQFAVVNQSERPLHQTFSMRPTINLEGRNHSRCNDITCLLCLGGSSEWHRGK
eukprot:3118883-Amphidinium_carterae.1